MRRHTRLLAAIIAVFGLIVPRSEATPIDNQASAVRGANRLLAIQNPSGTFPFLVGNPVEMEGVQGVTALGLDEAFKVSGDTRYLAAATRTRDWLASIANSGPCSWPGDTPPCRLAASSIYFLTEHALLTLRPADFALARRSLDEQLSSFGGATALVNGVINARKNSQGLGNLGLWDVGLFIRAASDVGRAVQADQMAAALNAQTIANPMDATATYYELGLAGVVLGLSEADLVAHVARWTAAATRLKSLQDTNGSWPSTQYGVVYGDDTQSTAYAVLALSAVADILPAQTGADFLRSVQRPDGSFAPWLPEEVPPLEYGEVDSEAIAALVAATLLVPSGAVAYTDIVRVV